jgi:hypothetical protein
MARTVTINSFIKDFVISKHALRDEKTFYMYDISLHLCHVNRI